MFPYCVLLVPIGAGIPLAVALLVLAGKLSHISCFFDRSVQVASVRAYVGLISVLVLGSLRPPVFLVDALPTVDATLAPYHLLTAGLLPPKSEVATEDCVVSVDVFTKHRAQLSIFLSAQESAPYTVAVVPMSAAFQARISRVSSGAVLQP